MIPAPEDVMAALMQREPIFHRPDFGTSREAFSAMMEDGFMEIGASGQIYSREYVLDVLEARHRVPVEEAWQTSAFQCHALSSDLYLLTYTLAQGSRITRRTTLWRRGDGDTWTIVFHQGTVVAAPI